MKNGYLLHFICFCIFYSGFYSSAQTWLQKGSNIYGQAANDYCGEKAGISGDGSTIAIGAVGNDQAGSNAGNVRAFNWNGVAWIQKGIDLTGDFSEDAAGQSLAINYDGSILVVGVAGYDTPLNSGQVRIYEWTGTAWILKGTPINGEVSSSYSGRSVSISDDGNRVAIGARYNSENGSNSGQVEVYDWNGTNWIQAGSDLNGDSNGDWFGEPVKLSSDGTVLAVGATQTMGTLPHLGYVKLYEWNGSDWIQKGSTIYGAAIQDQSGGSVALSYSGDTLAIGSIYNDDNGDESGHVRIFQWNGSAWSPLGTTLIGIGIDDHLGVSLSMSNDGTRLAVGATGSSNVGRLAVFEYNGSNWLQLGNLIYGNLPNDFFGVNDFTNNGDALIVAGAGNDFSATNAGKIQVYEFCAPTYSTQFINDCDSYTVPSGNDTYVTSGTYTDIILNTKGCDSVITINLNLNFSTFSTINPVACFSYNSPAGNVYTNSGTYSEIIPNSAGCDSTITIQLIVNTIDATVQILSDSLLAMPAGASYQWLDCNTNSIIPFETGQSYAPTSAGDYAVIAESNFGCIDTSDCQILNLGNSFWSDFNLQVFPNPVTDILTITDLPLYCNIIITDVNGRQLYRYQIDKTEININMADFDAGNYFLTFEYNNESRTQVIIKKH